MKTRVTFLSGYKPLAKTYKVDGTEPYPFVKKVTSCEEVVEISPEGLREKYTLIQAHAIHGNGLLKGNLKRQLNNESRSGLTDRLEDTHNIILDFDNITCPDFEPVGVLNSVDVTRVSEQFIKKLPEAFHNVSYIAHASSSFGRKVGKVGIHLDFFLTRPMNPKLLKLYITWLNFETEFGDQATLTASGTALKWPIDTSLADNTRIVYIAPPIFDQVPDPMVSAESRTVLVEKQNCAVDIMEQALEIDEQELNRLKQRKIDKLRRQIGLTKLRPKTQTVKVGNQTISVVTNPAQVTMSFAREGDEFVYYNINGGDSNAYYVRKTNPQIVYNFKGEPNFLFEKADPETYEWHCNTFKVDPANYDEAHEELLPIVFRDLRSDTHYNGLFNPIQNRFQELCPAQKSNLPAFVNQYGGIMPEPDEIPTWDLVFDPKDERILDTKAGFVNRFSPPKLMSSPPDLEDQYKYITSKDSRAIQRLCPTIYKIVFSICGGDSQAFSNFINWLAFCIQEREKSGVAWIFHGTQGTGKGVLYHRILAPIYTSRYTTMKRLENVEEHFNGWMETCLMLCIDEFKVKDSPTAGKLMNKLKNIITEPTTAIRRMRADQIEVPSFTNMLIFSNDHDSVNIPVDDRRFNVAPRQEQPLIKQYPTIRQEIEQFLDNEVPLFASLLMYLDVDKARARSAVENEAKAALRSNTMSSIEEFVLAFKSGDLCYFTQILELNAILSRNEYMLPAQNIVKSWLERYEDGETVFVPTEDLHTIYTGSVGPSESIRKFTKMLRHNGLDNQVQRNGEILQRGYATVFFCVENPRRVLRNMYCHKRSMEVPEFSKELM